MCEHSRIINSQHVLDGKWAIPHASRQNTEASAVSFAFSCLRWNWFFLVSLIRCAGNQPLLVLLWCHLQFSSGWVLKLIFWGLLVLLLLCSFLRLLFFTSRFKGCSQKEWKARKTFPPFRICWCGRCFAPTLHWSHSSPLYAVVSVYRHLQQCPPFINPQSEWVLSVLQFDLSLSSQQ